MAEKEDLAQRLRQSVQGCSQHLQGPVQVWHQLRVQFQNNLEKQKEVAMLAIEESANRIIILKEQGYKEEDPAVQKEIITSDFICSLYHILSEKA